jgi:hypothetical protein
MDIFQGLLSFIIFGAFVTSIWLGIIFIIGFSSGWRRLAKTYPDHPTAETFHEKSRVHMRLGRVSNFRGIVTLETTQEGLRFKVTKLFQPGCPNFLIPWSDLQGPQNDTLTGSFLPNIIFTTTKAPNILIKFTRSSVNWIQEKRQKFSPIATKS